MLQDPDRPPWLEDSLRHASARLITRIGDADLAALTEAVQTADQERAFQTLLACSDFFVEQVARLHSWLLSGLVCAEIFFLDRCVFFCVFVCFLAAVQVRAS